MARPVETKKTLSQSPAVEVEAQTPVSVKAALHTENVKPQMSSKAVPTKEIKASTNTAKEKTGPGRNGTPENQVFPTENGKPPMSTKAIPTENVKASTSAGARENVKTGTDAKAIAPKNEKTPRLVVNSSEKWKTRSSARDRETPTIETIAMAMILAENEKTASAKARQNVKATAAGAIRAENVKTVATGVTPSANAKTSAKEGIPEENAKTPVRQKARFTSQTKTPCEKLKSFFKFSWENTTEAEKETKALLRGATTQEKTKSEDENRNKKLSAENGGTKASAMKPGGQKILKPIVTIPKIHAETVKRITTPEEKLKRPNEEKLGRRTAEMASQRPDSPARSGLSQYTPDRYDGSQYTCAKRRALRNAKRKEAKQKAVRKQLVSAEEADALSKRLASAARSGNVSWSNPRSQTPGGNVPWLQQLKAECEDLDWTLPNQQRALHITAQYGFAEAVRFLVQSGVDINFTGKCHEYSPLHLAVMGGHRDTVEVLLDAGADVNVRDFADQTPVFHAVKQENRQCLYLLLQHDADVNIVNDKAVTPLMVAWSSGNQNLVTLLVEAGADVNKRRLNACRTAAKLNENNRRGGVFTPDAKRKNAAFAHFVDWL